MKRNTTIRSIAFAAGIALLALAAPAPRVLAQSASWNTSGTGAWSTAGNWLNNVPGSTSSTTSTDIATFGFTLTTGRAVTVDNNRNIGGIIFSNTSAFGYTLSSGNLLLSNGGVIQSATNNGAHTDTISSAIAIQGDGGSATFTAGGTNAASLLSIGGTITGVSTAGNTTTLTLNGDNTGNNVITGIIGNGSGGGRLAVVKSGNGVWRLSGANTFSGGVTLNSGTLQLGNNAALGTGTFTIAGGAIDVTGAIANTTNNNAQAWNGDFTYVGSNTLNLGTGAVALGATRTVTVNASTLTVGGVISGAGGITKAGPGTLNLGGLNTFTGPVVISSGTLRLNSTTSNPALANGGVASQTGASPSAAGNLVFDGGVLSIDSSGSITTDRSYTINDGKTAVIEWSSGNGSNLTISGSSAATTGGLVVRNGSSRVLTLSGNKNFTGGITVDTGILVLSGNNLFTNNVVVNGPTNDANSGILRLAGTGTNNNYTGTTTINNGGKLEITASGTWANNVTINAGGRLNATSNATVQFDGLISGAGDVNIANSSGLTKFLRTDNTYTGKTTLSTSAEFTKLANLGIASSFGAPTTAANGTIDLPSAGTDAVFRYLGTGDTTDRVLNFAGHTTPNLLADGSGPLVFTSPFTFTSAVNVGLILRGSNAGNNTIAGGIADGGVSVKTTLTKRASGRWVLTGGNSYTGATTVSEGELVVSSFNSVVGGVATSSLGAPKNATDGTITMNNGSQGLPGIISYVGTGETTDRALLFRNTNGQTIDHSGTGLLKFTTAVSSTSTGSNLSIVLRGSTSGTGELAGGFAGDNTGSGRTNLTKQGTGTWIISGSSNYRGTTTVSGGVLLLSTTAAVTGTAARPYTVDAAGAVATGFALDQTFLNRVVNTSAGAVALGANSSNNLDFSSAGANFTAASLGAAGSGTQAYTGTLTPNGTVYRLGGGGGTLDFQSLLSGGRTLTVGGDATGLGGAVILSRTDNSYTGKTTVNRGTLEIASLANVGGGNSSLGAPTTSANGTIDLGSGTAAATLRYVGSGHTSDRIINLAGTTGGATIEANGSGALVLTGANTATGAGTKVFTLTGTSTAFNSIGEIANNSSSNITSVNKTGSGLWRLSGANTYSGNTTVGEGILQFNSLASGTNAQSLGRGTLVSLGVAGTSAGEMDYYSATSGTLDKNITALGSGRNRIRNSGGGTLTLSGTLTKDGTILELAGGTFTVSGLITGANANSDLFVNGANVTLSNTNNDYNGPTYVYGGGSLTLGASNVIPAASSLILGGTGSDTGTGTINTGLFTDTIASLLTSSAGATVGISVNGSTAGGLTTTGNVTFGDGTDTLALSLTSPTLGRYTLLSYASRTGTFDSVTGSGNYNVVYGGTSIDLQHKATIGTITATPASATIIVGGTTSFGFTVQNSAPSLGADLLATVSTGSNVIGSATLGAVAAGATSSSVSGLSFTSNTVGLGQTGSFTLTDAAATNSPQQGSVMVDVLNHSLASFAATDMVTKTLNFGTFDNGVWTGGDGGNGTLGYSIFNIASLGFTDAQTAGLDLYDLVFTSGNDGIFSLGYSQFQNLASGSSNGFSASVLSPGSLVDGFYTATYTLKFRDQQNLSGAANTRDLQITLSANVIVVPEPGALALAGIGIAAAAYAYRRRRA